MQAALKSEDILILLKLASWGERGIDLELLSEELGHTTFEIADSIDRLKSSKLVDETGKIQQMNFREFILFGIQFIFPAHPGAIVQGTLTGAKPGMFFAKGLPYTSTYVWPNPNGVDQGFEIEPLSPHCYYAALNDSRLKAFLAVTETMRVAGSEARRWCAEELNRLL